MAPAVLALRSYRTMAQGWHKIRVMPQRHAREEPTQRQAELLGNRQHPKPAATLDDEIRGQQNALRKNTNDTCLNTD